MILALLLAAAGAQAEVPPPRTVNDQVIGTAEQFRVAGPARVCLIGTSVDLLAGENAYLDYLGIHFGEIRIVGPRGTFKVMEGSLREPRRLRLEEDAQGRTIGRAGPSGRPVYYLYAPNETVPDGESVAVRVEGDALGHGRDRSILDRIVVHPEVATGCTRQYRYGWDVLLPSEDDDQ